VLRVFPAAVGLDADGEPLGIYYGTLRSLVSEEVAGSTRQAAEAWIARLAESM
jgi:hypothetical protein